MRLNLLVATLLCIACTNTAAEDCNTSCGDQCRVKIPPPTICSPWGGCLTLGGGAEFIEPSCNAKCEGFKAISCLTGLTIPNIPISPVEVTKVIGTNVCIIPQQTVLQFQNSVCGFVSAQQAAQDNALIKRALTLLETKGAIVPADSAGVTFSFCPTRGDGIAPDRDRVVFDSTWRQNANKSDAEFAEFSTLVAHELFHVRQYREWGTDKFKCDYARQFVECGFCQTRNNSIERSAFEFGDAALAKLGYTRATFVKPSFGMTDVPPQRQTFVLQAGQVSERTSGNIVGLNIHSSCGTPVSDGYICNVDPTKPARAVYDLRRNHVKLQPGRYIVDVEYSSDVNIIGVAIHNNANTQLINFAATGGNGMNARRTLHLNVEFVGESADLIVDRGGRLPNIRAFVFRKLAD